MLVHSETSRLIIAPVETYSYLWARVTTHARLISSSQHFSRDLISLFIPHERAHLCPNLRCTEMNAVNPEFMTPVERLVELAEILAAGFQVLHPLQSSAKSADFGDSSLDC